MTTPSETPERARRPGRPRVEPGEGADVRERLLDAATELAVEQGFDACGLREIAARADVSAAMIAYYFGDRQGLHDAMFERAFDRVTEQVRQLIERAGDGGGDGGGDSGDAGDAASARQSGDEGDRLDGLVRIHVTALASDPWLPTLLAQDVLAQKDSALAARLADASREGPLRAVVSWIEDEQSRGILRPDLDPRLMALSIASLSVFPYLVLPIVGESLGIAVDGALAARLIEHNRELLATGVRVRPEDRK